MPQNSEVTSPVNDDSVMPDGIPILDPPYVTGIAPAMLTVGSPDTVIAVSGSGFGSLATGLVNGQPARYTQFVSNTSLRITVTAADLANPGQLQIAVINNTPASNSMPLTVK